MEGYILKPSCLKITEAYVFSVSQRMEGMCPAVFRRTSQLPIQL